MISCSTVQISTNTTIMNFQAKLIIFLTTEHISIGFQLFIGGYTVSTNSDKFPNILGGSDANLYIWKNVQIYKLKSYKFGNIS